MAVTHNSYSAAVEVAWKIAANTARSAGGTIGNIHLLYGIFSLDKVPCESLPAENRFEIQSEVARLGKIFTRSSVTFQQARRSIRSQLGLSTANDQSKEPADGRNAPSRSPSCRQAFEQAALAPNKSHGAQVRLIPLTRSLIEHEPTASAFLGIDEAAQSELLKSLTEWDDPPQAAEGSMVEDLRGTMSVFASLDADDSKVNWARVGEHFASICELTWRAGTSSKVEKLYDDSIQKLMAAIPAAQQAAILAHDPCGNLLLKAHFPKGVFPVSSSSARKAIEQRESFIWQRGGDMSMSQLESGLRAGIYAPILAAGEVFGVVCVDAKSSASRFTNDDLFLVTSLGHQLGLTLANRKLEESLRGSAKLLERLLTNFSPQVRNRLLLKAEAGRLKLGGERSVISILCSDIRGFTILTENMDAEEVVAMLNDYFTALVSVIFRHGGTVDKFIGDAIMAVFGSPEADPMHAEKSLRAALEMQIEVKRVSALREAAGLPHCEIGIGVHTGEVIHGFIGSNERMEFTVIGSAVNLASRYCSAAGGGDVIISAEILERVWKYAIVETVDVPTKHEGVLSAYRLLQMRAPV
jgi:adenylate cyclase